MWMAAITTVGAERKVYERLIARGYVAFFPYQLKRLYRGRLRKMHEAVRPLFPRIVFASPARDDHHEVDIESLSGVATVARRRFSGAPLKIPADCIAALMETSDADEVGHLIDGARWKRFIGAPDFAGRVGDLVEMIDNDIFLAGMRGEIIALDEARSEIAVSMEMFGAKRRVSVPMRAVSVLAA